MSGFDFQEFLLEMPHWYHPLMSGGQIRHGVLDEQRLLMLKERVEYTDEAQAEPTQTSLHGYMPSGESGSPSLSP